MLSEQSKCEVHEAAINLKYVEFGVHCGGWTKLETLVEKQRMAVKLSIDVPRVAQINLRKVHVPLPCIEFKGAPVPAAPTQPKPSATPMDLDTILAESGFSFANWRCKCTDCGLCFRCLKAFDKSHVDVCGCPQPEVKWLGRSNILKTWNSWGGALREDREAVAVVDKGKKRDLVLEVTDQSPFKRRSVLGPSGNPVTSSATQSTSDHRVDAIVGKPMSISELLFDRQLSGFVFEDECKSSHFVKTSCIHNPPFF
jgi:hypothetical protein